MGKIIFLCIVLYVGLYAGESSDAKQQLQKTCLQCHLQEQIPNDLIYRRYLVKYSTKEAMKKSIIKYLKNPHKENSIMPPPFFLKFPKKERSNLDEKTLEENIRAFLNTFDVKKKLVLPEQP